MEPYILNLQEFKGRKIIIDLPPREVREYVACNKEDWKVRVDSDAFQGEGEFLWNYEGGKKVIYSSYVIKNDPKKPISFDVKLPLWSVVPQPYIMLNNSPVLPCPGIKHDVIPTFKTIKVTDIYAEGRVNADCVFFSKNPANDFGLDLQIYAEIADTKYVLWEDRIMLNGNDNLTKKKATLKNEQYHLWDAQLTRDWSVDVDQELNFTVKSTDFIRLGIAVQIITSKEGFLGKKEDPATSLFSFDNFHYVMGFTEVD